LTLNRRPDAAAPAGDAVVAPIVAPVAALTLGPQAAAPVPQVQAPAAVPAEVQVNPPPPQAVPAPVAPAAAAPAVAPARHGAVPRAADLGPRREAPRGRVRGAAARQFFANEAGVDQGQAAAAPRHIGRAAARNARRQINGVNRAGDRRQHRVRAAEQAMGVIIADEEEVRSVVFDALMSSTLTLAQMDRINPAEGDHNDARNNVWAATQDFHEYLRAEDADGVDDAFANAAGFVGHFAALRPRAD